MENQASPLMSPDEAVLAVIIELRQGNALQGQQIAILRTSVAALEQENQQLKETLDNHPSNVSRLAQNQ